MLHCPARITRLGGSAKTLAVCDVALACGFASMSSFARAFREEHGHAPKMARRH
ncbi:helix-turn-helix domain-containing protein [Mesorhizobium sp. ES1-3]|nr:helix-turn-helix domain-containing protein [Mesorhizobium sp. ES1-3]